MKNFIILSLLVVVHVLGNVWISRGMNQIGEMNTLNPLALLVFGIHVFTNPWVWRGLVFLISALFLYLIALSRLELSYVLPMTASEYVLNALLSWLILGENISAIRWAGTLIVAFAVLIIGLSESKLFGKKKVKPKKEKARKNIYFCLLPFAFCSSKTWLAIIVMVLADSTGNLCFSRGMKQVGEVKTLRAQELLQLVRRAIANPMLGSGVLCMTIAFFMDTPLSHSLQHVQRKIISVAMLVATVEVLRQLTSPRTLDLFQPKQRLSIASKQSKFHQFPHAWQSLAR